MTSKSTFEWDCCSVPINLTPGQVVIGDAKLAPFQHAGVSRSTGTALELYANAAIVIGFMVWWTIIVFYKLPAWWILAALGVALLVNSIFYTVNIRAGGHVVHIPCAGWPVLSYFYARQQCARMNRLGRSA